MKYLLITLTIFASSQAFARTMPNYKCSSYKEWNAASSEDLSFDVSIVRLPGGRYRVEETGKILSRVEDEDGVWQDKLCDSDNACTRLIVRPNVKYATLYILEKNELYSCGAVEAAE